MDSAIWLFASLPEWFLSSIASPLSAGGLTLIPAVGTVCLALGVILAIKHRAKALWIFVVPAVMSQGLVAIAGLFRGALDRSSTELILMSFLVGQLALVLFLLYRQRRSWLPAALLSAFNLSYAFFAWFIATMAFTDQWL